MRVIDVGCVHERMQERLDGRARLVGLQRAAAQIVDHRRVVHRLSRPERLDLVEQHRGEPVAVIVARSVPEPFTHRTR